MNLTPEVLAALNDKGYARKIKREVEPYMLFDPEYAYQYARYVLRGRFERGEKLVAADAGSAYWYAKDVIGGPWIMGEEAIARTVVADDYLYFLEHYEFEADAKRFRTRMGWGD